MKIQPIFLALILAGSTALGTAVSAREITIGLAVANLQANFFNQIKRSVETYAKTKGIKVITVDAKGDGVTQINQVQDLLSQHIDALIYIPAGAAAATVPTRLAQAQHVPVVNVDRNAAGQPGNTFIASDSVKSAYEVCRYLFVKAGGKADMIIVHGQKGTTPEVDRSKGCAQARKEYPGIKVVAEQWSQAWSQDEGFQLTQNMLQAHTKTTIVWGQADALALGAAQAVKVANLGHRVWIGGFDGDTAALKALNEGVFDVTATQQTQYMGRLAIDSAIKLINKENVPKMQLLPATSTTKENVADFIANHP